MRHAGFSVSKHIAYLLIVERERVSTRTARNARRNGMSRSASESDRFAGRCCGWRRDRRAECICTTRDDRRGLQRV